MLTLTNKKNSEADNIELWGMQVGCLRVRYLGEPASFDISGFYQVLQKKIEESQQVTEITWMKRKAARFDTVSNEGNILLDPPIIFRFFLPEKNQKYGLMEKNRLPDKTILSEEIYIIYNGNIALFLRKIEKDGILGGGPDIRDAFKSILSFDNNFEVEIIGPTPLREDFFLVVGEDESSISQTKRGVKWVLPKIEKREDLFKLVYSDIFLTLFFYYDALERENELKFINLEIIENIEMSLNELNDIYNAKFYQIRKELNGIGGICKNIREIYLLLSQGSEKEQSYIGMKERAIGTVSDSLMLDQIKGDLLKEFDQTQYNVANIYQTLSFLRDEIKSRKNNWIFVLVSIIGILLGIAGGYLLGNIF